MTKRARWLLPIVTLLVIFGLAEIAVRFVSGARLSERGQPEANILFAAGRMLEPVEADGMRYCGRPDASVSIYGIAYHNNSLGLRGPELEPGRRPDRFRILVLGDSNTFGWRAKLEDTFCARVERLLNATPAPAPRVEVVNAGIVGYNTADELALFNRLAPVLEPDLVLIAWFANDLDRLGNHVDHNGFMFCDPLAGPDAWKPLLWHSYLYRWWSVHTINRMKETGEYVPGQGANVTFSEQQLLALVDAIRARGAKIAALDVPWLEGSEVPGDQLMHRASYRGADFSALFSAWTSRANVPLLQLIDSIEGQPVALCWASIEPPDHHPSARIHELYANAIDRFLRQQKLVPGR